MNLHRDVVADTAAHQQNLDPGPVRSDACLLALPESPWCKAVAADWFRDQRRGMLERCARHLGGGDGPLPCVDLENDDRPLDTVLDTIRRSGVRRLYVAGIRAQPSYARAVSARWPGSLEPVRADWDVPGVAGRVRRMAGGPEAPQVVVAADGDGPPCSESAGEAGCAADPEGLVAPWSGFLPPAALGGDAAATELRGRWWSYWEERGLGAAVRNAALGLDPDFEARATRATAGNAMVGNPSPQPSTASRVPAGGARLVAITGIDGAGKSTQVARLEAHLRDLGYSTGTLKIYRQGGFLQLANELGARTRRGAPLAAFRVSRIVKLIDSLRVLRDDLLPWMERFDVVLLDRYLETHVAAAASQLGWDLTEHPVLRAFPAAATTVWLRLPIDDALARLDERSERRSADEHEVGLRGYSVEFDRLAGDGPGLVLDAAASREENAGRIREHVGPLLPANHPAPAGSRDVPRSTSPDLRPSRPARSATIGGTGNGAGDEVFHLKRFLAQRGTPLSDERFWMEAYVSQVLLDLLTTPAEQVHLRVWPGTLAAMEGWQDVSMLAELDRMIRPLVTVHRGILTDEELEAFFVEWGSTAAGAERLRRAYRSAEISRANSAAPIAPAS